MLIPPEIWHEYLKDWSTSPVRCTHFTLGNPNKSFRMFFGTQCGQRHCILGLSVHLCLLEWLDVKFCLMSLVVRGLIFFLLVFWCWWPSVLWLCWLGGRKGILSVKTEIKIKPRICVLFILCLTWTVNANSLKQNIIVIKEICSWLPAFCKPNLLFIQPRWRLRRTYFFNHYITHLFCH